MRVHKGERSQTRLIQRQIINAKGTEDIIQDITCYGTILWHTREEVCAALSVLLFVLVLSDICVGMFIFSYVCKLFFKCTCELLSAVMCLLKDPPPA